MTNHHQWASVPPLGWNSWDCYGAAVGEKEVRGNAEYMAEYTQSLTAGSMLLSTFNGTSQEPFLQLTDLMSRSKWMHFSSHSRH